MPKNLGLYDDDLSTPRKKDVDNCYGPNNAPPYPVTSVSGKTGAVTLTKANVGLNNVDNVKQYSANNPPPYPVTSVNEKTGDITLSASDVSAVPTSGGTITGTSGDTPLKLKSASSSSYVGFVNASGTTLGYVGYSKTSSPAVYTDKAYKIYHEGNKPKASDVGLGNVDNVKQYSASNPPPYPVTSVSGKTGAVTLTKANVGLGNVDNVKQYSADNPPPYPVKSVSGKTGAVTLSKSDVGLGNVENVKQYSASNPPPYPVTSVNGKTGAVTIDSGGVAIAIQSAQPSGQKVGDLWYQVT